MTKEKWKTLLNLIVTIITAIAATLIVFCYIVTLLHCYIVTLRRFTMLAVFSNCWAFSPLWLTQCKSET